MEGLRVHGHLALDAFRTAVSLSMGFGGISSAICLEKW